VGELFAPTHLIVLSMVASFYGVVIVVPFWMIFKKSGFPGALSLLMVVPMVNLIMLYILAFSRWKVVPARGGGLGQFDAV